MRRVNRLHWLVSVAVLAAQQATFILLLHHSRFAAASGGNRYIPSTVLLLCEVIKFTISLTGALYEISKPTNPTISVTSLFGALAHKVLCGDGWKLAIPATLYSIANTLVFTALFNLDPAAFQIAYQAQLIIGAIVAYALLRRTVDQERIASLVFLAVGMIVALWHKAKETNDNELDEKRLSTGPRSILEFKRVGTAMGGSFMKRSATYEGMDEDLIIAYPDMDTRLGLLAAVGAAAASAVAGSTLEAITGEIMDSTVMWVRNVQLSIFSMLAIGLYGVGSQDAEQIAKQGFFGGYDYVTWILIVLQASLGLCTAMCFASGQISRKATASRLSTAVVLLVSLRMHEFPDETMVSHWPRRHPEP
ncbi:hypothetical protein KEM52_005369 [Ascosphaera acerosa]|nr:hypothetical protein KEM52_005369 [Ascosphaera acerosa]